MAVTLLDAEKNLTDFYVSMHVFISSLIKYLMNIYYMPCIGGYSKNKETFLSHEVTS